MYPHVLTEGNCPIDVEQNHHQDEATPPDSVLETATRRAQTCHTPALDSFHDKIYVKTRPTTFAQTHERLLRMHLTHGRPLRSLSTLLLV